MGLTKKKKNQEKPTAELGWVGCQVHGAGLAVCLLQNREDSPQSAARGRSGVPGELGTCGGIPWRGNPGARAGELGFPSGFAGASPRACCSPSALQQLPEQAAQRALSGLALEVSRRTCPADFHSSLAFSPWGGKLRAPGTQAASPRMRCVIFRALGAPPRLLTPLVPAGRDPNPTSLSLSQQPASLLPPCLGPGGLLCSHRWPPRRGTVTPVRTQGRAGPGAGRPGRRCNAAVYYSGQVRLQHCIGFTAPWQPLPPPRLLPPLPAPSSPCRRAPGARPSPLPPPRSPRLCGDSGR